MQRSVLVGLFALAGCDRVFNLEDVHGALDPDALDPDARTGYAGAVLADHPVAYWRLGLASAASAVDETPNGNVGSFNGGVTVGALGAVVGDPDTAMTFNGVDAYVAMGDRLSFEGRAPFTVELWARPTEHHAYLGLVSKTDEDAGGFTRKGYHLYSQYQYVGAERNDGMTSQAVSVPKLPLSVWSYVVMTYDGTTLSFYIDATLKGSDATDVAMPPTNNTFAIGARNGGAHSWFFGDIDEVAIYDYALAAPQIENHRRVALGQ
jgi:hypothetical protein